MKKLATALIVTGLTVAPVASYANGTMGNKSDATNAQAGTTATQSQSGMTNHAMGQKTGAALSDAAITTKVKAKFAADSTVSATKIHVDTDNGVVKLTGTAKSQRSGEGRRNCEEHRRRCLGRQRDPGEPGRHEVLTGARQSLTGSK